MRRPAEEHHGLLAPHGAVDGGEHAGLAGLDQLELAQAELVLADHRLDLGVGAGAWLDAVDLAAKLLLELGDVSKGFQALVGQVLGHGEGRAGVVEARLVEDLDLFGVDERGDGLGHDRVPVAEEHVQALVADTGENDLLRGTGLLGLVAQAIEQDLGHGAGGHHIGPVHHAKAHVLAGRRFCGDYVGAEDCGTDEHQQATADHSVHGGSSNGSSNCYRGRPLRAV
ncbi:hypothetical protein D3C78_465790 [compost metagenome]